jgi:DNA-binding beta-propeller fold protein YncE
LALSALLLTVQTGASPEASAAELKVISDQTETGFKFPESVGCDPAGKALYVSQFGSELKPTEKDGKGKISKLSMTGKVLEDRFLPPPGELFNKPKGIWIKGNRLWVTDIDVLWVFDLKTRKGRKVALPEAQFANDVALLANALYVSDNRTDRLYKVEPADFLNVKGDPKVTVVFSGKSINPNGVYPAKDGSLLVVGFISPEQARGIHAVGPKGDIKELSKPIGRLDGLYQMNDGTLLVTDWNSGSLFSWTAKGGMKTLASNFKGPADLCAFPNAKGVMVVVPDLVKSEVRLIQLGQ